MKDFMQKYNNGDPLSDDELISLQKSLVDVYKATYSFGERYKLVADDAFRIILQLEDFARSRGIPEHKLSKKFD